MAVSFSDLTMGWNSHNVKPFSFGNTMAVKEGHPLRHLIEWTGVVARGAPGGKLNALVINCHGYSGDDYRGSLDSAGGIPRSGVGFGLNIGEGIVPENADLFSGLAGLVGEIHIYGCGAADTPVRMDEVRHTNMCQTIANASRATVVASLDYQPDLIGPGLNLAPAMVGRVVRFTPSKP